MNNPGISLKLKAGGSRLLLFLAVLISVLGAQPVLAQPRQFDMALRLVPNRAGFIEVDPGRETPLFLEVNNIGGNDLTDVKLSSDKGGGWIISFAPAVIPSLAAGSIQTVNVSIVAPRDESATTFPSAGTETVKPVPPFAVAISPGGTSGQQESINIIAEAKEIRKVENFTLTVSAARLNLNLLSADRFPFRNEVRARQDNAFELEVSNTGSTVVTGIRLSSDTAGWTVAYSPSRIETLAPGGIATVDVTIRPPAKATTEDVEVRFIADANETRQVQSFFFTVKPAQVWIWVWIAAGVAVVGMFVFVYMRMSRQ